jgi:hypothetical protein
MSAGRFARRTMDPSQAERCKKALAAGTAITEKFGSAFVTGKVQSVIDHKDANPRQWNITFIDATMH